MAGECQLHNNTKKIFSLGQVDFINCLPINLPIELNEINLNVNILNAVPSELNRKIINGEIDIAPVSSYAYLTNKDKLTLISDLCIASNGPADSVLLFSKFPIEELDGAKIGLSTASATSNKLLEIILKEFLNIKHCKLLTSSESKDYPAQLLIGDRALLEFSKMPRNIFIYDLGSLWKKHTGLPMVFGVWVTRREVLEEYPDEIQAISTKLRKSKDLGLTSMFDKVVKKAQEKVLISKEFYNTYFQHLTYDLTEEHIKGLKTFEEFCKKPEQVIITV